MIKTYTHIILIYYVIASCNAKSMSMSCCVFYDIEPGCKLSFSPLVKAFVKIFCRPCGQLIANFGTEKWKNGRSMSTYIWEDDSPWTLTQPCHRWSWRIKKSWDCNLRSDAETQPMMKMFPKRRSHHRCCTKSKVFLRDSSTNLELIKQP